MAKGSFAPSTLVAQGAKTPSPSAILPPPQKKKKQQTQTPPELPPKSTPSAPTPNVYLGGAGPAPPISGGL
jgi:hypothetical protein